MGKVKVAIIGVGNCASALVQGVHFYRGASEEEFVPGLMHVRLGDYNPQGVGQALQRTRRTTRSDLPT